MNIVKNQFCELKEFLQARLVGDTRDTHLTRLALTLIAGIALAGCSPSSVTAPAAVFDDVVIAEEGLYQNILFDFDSAELQAGSDEIITLAADRLEADSSIDLVLEGNADERGTNAYNLALGYRRAETIKQALLILGVAGDRVRTISYGEERPVDNASRESAWRLNRRVEVVEE